MIVGALYTIISALTVLAEADGADIDFDWEADYIDPTFDYDISDMQDAWAFADEHQKGPFDP